MQSLGSLSSLQDAAGGAADAYGGGQAARGLVGSRAASRSLSLLPAPLLGLDELLALGLEGECGDAAAARDQVDATQPDGDVETPRCLDV